VCEFSKIETSGANNSAQNIEITENGIRLKAYDDKSNIWVVCGGFSIFSKDVDHAPIYTIDGGL
jgi:hypothetical protein